MSDDDLKAINLFKTLIGKDIKFFPVDYPTTSAKTKTESKYTREKLEAMDRKEIAKVYRAVIPYSDRCNEKNTKAEYALKPFMIEAILKA